jgi:hypothetical protein
MCPPGVKRDQVAIWRPLGRPMRHSFGGRNQGDSIPKFLQPSGADRHIQQLNDRRNQRPSRTIDFAEASSSNVYRSKLSSKAKTQMQRTRQAPVGKQCKCFVVRQQSDLLSNIQNIFGQEFLAENFDGNITRPRSGNANHLARQQSTRRQLQVKQFLSGQKSIAMTAMMRLRHHPNSVDWRSRKAVRRTSKILVTIPSNLTRRQDWRTEADSNF